MQVKNKKRKNYGEEKEARYKENIYRQRFNVEGKKSEGGGD